MLSSQVLLSLFLFTSFCSSQYHYLLLFAIVKKKNTDNFPFIQTQGHCLPLDGVYMDK